MSLSDDVYKSRMAGQQIIVQGAEPIFAQGTGTMIGRTKELTAEFAKFGPEVRRMNDDDEQVVDDYTGEALTTAAIYGNVFNLQAQAKEKGWTEAEMELVRAKVDYQCELTPQDVWKVAKVVESAPLPWPTYDDTHHNQLPVIAEATGTVLVALAYERENKNRAGVVAKLEELSAASAVAEELTAA